MKFFCAAFLAFFFLLHPLQAMAQASSGTSLVVTPLDFNQWKIGKDLSQCPEIDTAYNSPQIQQQFKVSQQLCDQADAEERNLTILAAKIAERLVQTGVFAEGAAIVKPLTEQTQYKPSAYARTAQALEPLKPRVQAILFEEAEAYFPPDKWKVIKITASSPSDYVVYATPLEKSDAQPFTYRLEFEPSVANGVNIVLASAADQDSAPAQAAKFAGWRGPLKATVEVAFRDDVPVQISSYRKNWRCFASYDQFFVQDANALYQACQAKAQQ